jgi:carbon storage regulator
MLVIQRRIGEGVNIGEEVFVKVLSVHGRRVKLGIEAPAHLAIARDKLPALARQQAHPEE